MINIEEVIRNVVAAVSADDHAAAERAIWEFSQDNCMVNYQRRVASFCEACFGNDVAQSDRTFRFLEEALELAQACGCTTKEAETLLKYVFGRPAGEPAQEIGGVMVTLSALCYTMDVDLKQSAVAELNRVENKIDQIRHKHVTRPTDSPLPGTYA